MKLAAFLFFVALGFLVANVNCLTHNYYKHTCPNAEHLVAKMVKDFIAEDIGIAPEIIRLHFHDCFVRGCDGSVLLNSTTGNKAERDAPPNNPSLDGFDEIDKIKEALEKQCPNVVSCADIIAYAARESVFLSGRFPHYAVKGGRKDGRVSRAKEALKNLPPPNSNVSSLIQRFALKGLSAKEMVTLSGIHSIGDSFCSSILGRFNNFNNTGKPDPTMNKNLAASLRKKCKNVNNKVELDTITPTNLDNKYYTGLLQHKGLFTSDAALLTDKLTLREVKTNAAASSVWEKKFVRAMKKMGEIGVLSGKKGEIRRKCSIVN